MTAVQSDWVSHKDTVGLNTPHHLPPKAIPSTRSRATQIKSVMLPVRTGQMILNGHAYPKLVLGAPVEDFDSTRELLAIIAWLETIALGKRQVTMNNKTTRKAMKQQDTECVYWGLETEDENPYRIQWTQSSSFFICTFTSPTRAALFAAIFL